MNERNLLRIVVAFVARAGDFGVAVIVGGIETVEPFDFDIDHSQGYHQSASVLGGVLGSLLRAGPAPSGRSGLPSATVAGKPT